MPGTFLRRLNRFAVQVQCGTGVGQAHLPNSGRLGELLILGARVWLLPRPEPGRRTAWDLSLVETDGRLVSVDARRPNELVAVALDREALPELPAYTRWRREVRLGRSRFDFLLSGGPANCVVEVKSVTLVIDRVARFPDAPTLRGTRHVRELTHLAEEGQRAAVLFVVQRVDAEAFGPNDGADPAFAAALRKAAKAGVLVRAYSCSVTREALELVRAVPVLL